MLKNVSQLIFKKTKKYFLLLKPEQLIFPCFETACLMNNKLVCFS